MPSHAVRTLATLALLATALAAPSSPATAAPQPCDQTFGGPGGLAIPDSNPTGVASTLQVAPTGPIGRVVVTLNITHTFDADLDLTLRRGSTVLDLSSDNGGSGDNYSGTRFSDGASTPIQEGAAPFTGTFRPEDALSVFRDREANGSWTLRVVDDAGADVGTLGGWTLEIHFADCNVDTDEDGASDRQDNCPTVANPDQADADADGTGNVCEDGDGDGVFDSLDQCPTLPGSTSSGCPAKKRTLSIDRTKSAFTGRLLSTTLSACHQSKPVQVFRQKSGADQLLGTAQTKATGKWSLTKAAKRGTYYAVSPRVVIPDAGECVRTVSKTLRVR